MAENKRMTTIKSKLLKVLIIKHTFFYQVNLLPSKRTIGSIEKDEMIIYARILSTNKNIYVIEL